MQPCIIFNCQMRQIVMLRSIMEDILPFHFYCIFIAYLKKKRKFKLKAFDITMSTIRLYIHKLKLSIDYFD